MAASEAELQEYENRLTEAMATEAGSVRDADGTMLKFRSLEELRSALSQVRKELKALSPTRKKFPRSLKLHYRKKA